jgi:hypothetical protein
MINVLRIIIQSFHLNEASTAKNTSTKIMFFPVNNKKGFPLTGKIK